MTNFGVETYLQHVLKMTTSPLPRMSDKGLIDPMEEEDFSAFVFKIQANMNKAHRDLSLIHICEGCRGDRVRHALWGNHADDGAWFRYG